MKDITLGNNEDMSEVFSACLLNYSALCFGKILLEADDLMHDVSHFLFALVIKTCFVLNFFYANFVAIGSSERIQFDNYDKLIPMDANAKFLQ